jgi:hypothetical protein
MSDEKRFHTPIRDTNGEPDNDAFNLATATAVLQRASVAEIRAKSISNLDRWESNGAWDSAYGEWLVLMTNGSDEQVIDAMTGNDHNATRLRQSPPYVGFLDESTQEAIWKRVRTKRLFLDTEFTDFIDCDLISIGIVSEDGQEFYAERNDFDRAACSNFAHEAVLTQLGKDPACVGSSEEIRSALLKWLGQFQKVEICVDYSTDWDLLIDLCQRLPDHVTGRNIASDLDPIRIEQYWRKNGRRAHHALHDARANQFAFLAGASNP